MLTSTIFVVYAVYGFQTCLTMFNLSMFWAKVLMAAPQFRGSPRHVTSAPRVGPFPPSGPRNVTGSWIRLGFWQSPIYGKIDRCQSTHFLAYL